MKENNNNKISKKTRKTGFSDLGNRSIGFFDAFASSELTRRILWCVFSMVAFAFIAYFIVNALASAGNISINGSIVIIIIAVAVCVFLFHLHLTIAGFSTRLKAALSEDEDIIRNIAGGTIISYNDDFYTIKSATDMFYEILGYSRGDIKAKYHNEFARLLVGEESKREFAKQRHTLQKEGYASAQYKLLCKDGTTRWVSAKSYFVKNMKRETVVYTTFFDISSEMDTQEKLLLAEKRNQIIFEIINSGVFEIDLMKNNITFSDQILNTYDLKDLSSSEAIDFERVNNVIYEDDREKMLLNLNKIRNGELERTEVVIRILQQNGRYEHISINITALCDNNQIPVRAIGIMTNIEDRYNKELELRRKADRDSLSGLYNKGATKKLIENTIERRSDEKHAVLLCDVDDFKSINDTLGHDVGDEAIITAARLFEKVFGSGSVVGRVGGDEFMVMARDIGDDIDPLLKKLEQVKTEDPHVSAGSKVMHMTFSIGVTFYPSDGVDYKTLYKNADIALYKAKKGGKNRYELYQHTISE